MKTKHLSCYILPVLSLIIVGSGIWILSPIHNTVNLSNKSYYIAHAAGEINGLRYTNCKEALLHSLDEEFQYIELDLRPLADSSLVAIHDIAEFNKMTGFPDNNNLQTLEEFKQRRIYKEYSVMTLQDALEIQQKRPFILVSDKTDDPILLDRYFAHNKREIIVEAFSWQRYVSLKEHGYSTMMGFDEKNLIHYIYYCIRSKQHIDWITSSAYSYSDILKLRILKKLFGVKIAFVPLKKPAHFYKDYIGNEFDMIYTDRLIKIE